MSSLRRRVACAWVLLLLVATALDIRGEPAASAATEGETSAPDAPASAVLPDAPSTPVVRHSLDDFNPAIPEEPRLAYDMELETQRAYEGALRAYYAYRQRGYEQRLEAFAWQAFSSRVIFFVVLVLVFSGIGFAAIQFTAGMRVRGGAETLDTEFAVDVKGLRVRSPVLGVVVLAISLAFFYLYLVYVYPIVNVF